MLPLLLLLFASVRLHLKDGSFQSVREYEVKQDRIRYYSIERGDWEEIPLDLVDLDRTRKEQADLDAERKTDAAAAEAEDKADRALRREVARVPEGNGVYHVRGNEIAPVKQAECKVVNDKKRSILKAISPIPLVAGKSTLEVDGVTSATVIAGDRPEFYIRLSAEERFTIIRLAPAKISRIVQRWSIIPVSKELVTEQDDVEIFRQQAADNLYKIWPKKPLAPGEYAVVQYTEGKGNTQVWDFALRAP